MSRLHPHYFPDDTPDPIAEPYGAMARLIDSTAIAAGVLVAIGSLAVIFYFLFIR